MFKDRASANRWGFKAPWLRRFGLRGVAINSVCHSCHCGSEGSTWLSVALLKLLKCGSDSCIDEYFKVQKLRLATHAHVGNMRRFKLTFLRSEEYPRSSHTWGLRWCYSFKQNKIRIQIPKQKPRCSTTEIMSNLNDPQNTENLCL